MRITFIDSANKKSEILTEYENGPYDVTTQAERESILTVNIFFLTMTERNGKFYFWDQCDDTETESRFWTEVNKSARLIDLIGKMERERSEIGDLLGNWK